MRIQRFEGTSRHMTDRRAFRSSAPTKGAEPKCQGKKTPEIKKAATKSQCSKKQKQKKEYVGVSMDITARGKSRFAK